MPSALHYQLRAGRLAHSASGYTRHADSKVHRASAQGPQLFAGWGARLRHRHTLRRRKRHGRLVPPALNASGAASARMPFPRLLKPATGVALCGLIFHWVMRLHFGDDTPPWASDWFALTNHTGSDTSWSWGEDNAPELIMCCIGGVSAFVWRKYGADAASSLRRGSSARRLMRRSSSRTFSVRSISHRLHRTIQQVARLLRRGGDRAHRGGGGAARGGGRGL